MGMTLLSDTKVRGERTSATVAHSDVMMMGSVIVVASEVSEGVSVDASVVLS
jgi:tetrahydrodipicolinate N-succinyltransferase